MLLSSYEWERATVKIRNLPRSREINLKGEERAVVRLLVSLENDWMESGADMFVLLMVKDLMKHERAGGENMRNARQHLAYDTQDHGWTEVHRARVRARGSGTELQYPLKFDGDYDLRVDFYERHSMGESSKIGGVPFKLQELLLELNASKDYTAVDDEGGEVSGHVRIGATSIRNWANRCIFEVKMQVDKKAGWPFSSARLFFVIYARNANDRWLPVYRSEVLTKPSDHPDAEKSMFFAPAEVKNADLISPDRRALRSQDDQFVLRIEFFHYKTSAPSILIGYLETTAIKLRQAQVDNLVPLHVNSFTKGELVGSMTLRKKEITANTSYYSFMVKFGGELKKQFVVFDVSVNFANSKRVNAFTKPYFMVRRGNEDGPLVYYSERPRQNRGGRYEYKSVRISKKKLFGKIDDKYRPLLLGLYTWRLRKENMQLATIETSVLDLLAKDVGTKLPLRADGNTCPGHVRVGLAQEVDDCVYVKLDFVLEADEKRVSED